MLSLLIGFKRLTRCLVRCFKKEETKALLVATGIILLIGTIFYHNIEKMTFVDSFYFSFVTLATIGYGDLHPITTIGKLFTVLYGVLGLGMVSLSVGVIAREFIQIRNENQENSKKKETNSKNIN